jgi:hypothetical protein
MFLTKSRIKPECTNCAKIQSKLTPDEGKCQQAIENPLLHNCANFMGHEHQQPVQGQHKAERPLAAVDGIGQSTESLKSGEKCNVFCIYFFFLRKTFSNQGLNESLNNVMRPPEYFEYFIHDFSDINDLL